MVETDMTVADVMTVGVETVRDDDSIQTAAERMKARSVGMLLVVRAGTPVGVVTDRDITVRSTALGSDPWRALVSEAMTPQIHSCSADAAIEDAARIMEARAVRRLVVVGADGRAVGILSVDDLATRVRDEELAGEVVGHAAEPSAEWP